MNKKQREIIFNKYGGKCYYCGCELSGARWHCDHAEPIQRKTKTIPSGWFHKETGEPMPNDFKKFTEEEFEKHFKNYEFKPSRLAPNGCHHPENDTMDNMMPSCASCNINKHSMNIDEFRAFIGGFINSLNRHSVQYKIAKRYGLIVETKFPVVFYFEKYKK